MLELLERPGQGKKTTAGTVEEVEALLHHLWFELNTHVWSRLHHGSRRIAFVKGAPAASDKLHV